MASSEGSPGQDPASDSSVAPTTETITGSDTVSANFNICGITLDFKHPVLVPAETTYKAHRTFKDLRLDGTDCNIVIECGGRHMRAHQELLKERIPYFHYMFAHEFMEKSSGVVSLSTHFCPLDSASIQALIGFSYHGEIIITEDNASSLLAAAAYLQMDTVIDACANFLFKRVQCDDALSLLAYFRFLSVDHDRLWRFIDANFVVISGTNTFTDTPIADLLMIVQRDSLRIDCEEQVFEAVSRWIEVDWERWEDGARLLKHVRLPSLRNSFISECIADKDWVKENPDCLALLSQHENPECKERRSDRFSYDALNLICILDAAQDDDGEERETGGRLRTFNPLTGAFAEAMTPWLPPPRVCAVAEGHLVFFFGGIDSTVRVLDTRSNSFSDLPTMPSEKIGAAINIIDGILYVAGGVDGDLNPTASLLSLNTREQNPVWKELAPMLIARSLIASCVFNGLIYVFGGSNNDSEAFDHAEVYDPAKNEWTPIAPMSRPTYAASAIVVDGRIIVSGGITWAIVGGIRGIRWLLECEEYDPLTDTWKSLPDMEHENVGSSFFSSGRLMVYCHEFPEEVEVYDPAKSEWKMMKAALEAIWGDCIFSVSVPATIPLPITAFEDDQWHRIESV